MSLRGIAAAIRSNPQWRLASTRIPSNDNDPDSIRGSVLLEAIPKGIASDCSAGLRNASQRQQYRYCS